MRDLLAKQLIVVTGKGGVGKTTVAAALGCAAAADGLRTIVAEVSGRDDVGLAFTGRQSADPFVERMIADGLSHISIDPQHAVEEYLEDQLPVRALADMLASSRLFTYLTAATPGLRELVTIGKVWELTQPARRTRHHEPYDLVVLDAPATGHGVALLRSPRTFAQAARVGPIARQGEQIASQISDPAWTAVVAVATAEEMPVNETLGLPQLLGDATGLPLSAVVVNQMLPQRLTGPQAAAVEQALPASGGELHHALHVAHSQHARASAQRRQLQRLRRGVPQGTPVLTLPQLPPVALQGEDFALLGRKLVGGAQ